MLSALVLLLLATPELPQKGEPPLTERTKRSGGAIDPEQAKLRFDDADLAFELLPDARRLNGTATLTFTPTAPLDELRIDLDRNLPVSAISIDGRALPRESWSNPDGRLVVKLPGRVPAGRTFRARISYAGTPHVAVRAPWDDGVVWSQAPGGRTWFATTAQGYGCDLFWPCLDFPTGEPAAATLRITVPAGLSAPSNGRLLGVDKLPDGRTTWNWRVKRPNTYGLALNVAPYEQVSGTYRSRYGNAIPMHYWHLPGRAAQARGLFAEFAPTLDFFEAVIGPYPFADEKMGVVETPHLGMEHQTINAYGNEYRKAVEGFDWLFHHEFAHEWFANQLTAADWDDFWLHEGFATYMQPLYGRWREGEARYAAMMDLQRQQITNKAPIVRGRPMTSEEVYETAKGGPGVDIYYKGSWILHTLRRLIGDKAFFDATRLLVYGRPDPRPGNFAPRFATTRDFEGYVRQVTGRDHGWFFDTYLRQAALPELIERREGGRLLLEWRTAAGAPFPLPIEVAVDGRIEHVPMTGGRGVLAVPAGAHVVVDPHARVLRRSLAVEAMQAQRAGAR
ncbi:M1 family metallopeptidase [Sphingomonas lenta]|uniref:Peptidase M1 n=1 Tax=Sphingomonas lenta TaxID=1141887 RepID=A0A2A2SKC6_9SPHN|nr:M1 family metallopeptidase [Sphingomonas lenta]PAX09692.1 peptidase M1 [Sphingomonas lenta]